jgi:hypothetical protein
MPGQGLSPTARHDSRAHARVIYDSIKGTLERSFKGKILAIEVESGEHCIGDTMLEAARKARAKHSDKAFHFFRIGFPTVYVWRAGRCPAGSGTSPGPWPWHACALPVV